MSNAKNFPAFLLATLFSLSMGWGHGASGQTLAATLEADVVFGEGVRYYDQGLFLNAASSFQKAHDLMPASPVYLYNLGMSYFKLGNYKKAEESFLLAIQIAPRYGKAYQGLGFVLEKQGKNDLARVSYLNALAAAPDDSFALRGLRRLEDISPAGTGRKPWSLDIRTSSTRLETNPAQLPDISNPRVDLVLVPIGDFVYDRWARNDLRLRFLYNFEYDYYAGQRDLTFFVHFLRGETQFYRSRKMNLYAQIESENYIGTTGSFYQSTGLGMGFEFPEAWGSRWRAGLRLKDEIFPSARARDAINIMYEISLARTIWNSQFAVSLQQRNRDSGDPDFDYDRTALSIVYARGFWENYIFRARYVIMPRNYTNVDSVAGIQRRDTLQQLLLEIRRPISENLEFRIGLQSFTNTSTIPSRRWNDIIVNTGIDLRL